MANYTLTHHVYCVGLAINITYIEAAALTWYMCSLAYSECVYTMVLCFYLSSVNVYHISWHRGYILKNKYGQCLNAAQES